jgi:hypothetical protein
MDAKHYANLDAVATFHEAGSRPATFKGNQTFNNYMSEDAGVANLMKTANGKRKTQNDGLLPDSFGLYDSGMHHTFLQSARSAVSDLISSRDIVEMNIEAIVRVMLGLVSSPHAMKGIEGLMQQGQVRIDPVDWNSIQDLFYLNSSFGNPQAPVTQCRFSDQVTTLMGTVYSLANKLLMAATVVQDVTPLFEAASQVMGGSLSPAHVGYAMAGSFGIQLADTMSASVASIVSPYGSDQFGVNTNPAATGSIANFNMIPTNGDGNPFAPVSGNNTYNPKTMRANNYGANVNYGGNTGNMGGIPQIDVNAIMGGMVNNQANPAFGNSNPAFGNNNFGITTPAFDANNAYSASPAFGGTNQAFGNNNFGVTTPAFGNNNPAFGGASFGATTPAFGNNNFGVATQAFGGVSNEKVLYDPRLKNTFGF